MASLAFDTLKAARRLGDAGFSDEQADAIVGTMADSVAENLATKDDLKLLDAKIDGVAERLEAKIEALRSDVVHMGNTMTVRLGSLVIGGFIVVEILDRFWAT